MSDKVASIRSPGGSAPREGREVFRTDDLLGGTYRIRNLIGEGDTGLIYEAKDERLERTVAIKTASTKEARGALIHEAKAFAAVPQSGATAVFAFGEHEGIPYIVMENVLGMSLAAHIRKRQVTRLRYSIRETLELLIEIADALTHVHRAGTLQCHLSPESILLTSTHRAVLLDLRLSCLPPKLSALSHYAAPEIRHRPSDGRALISSEAAVLVDMYALGAVALEILTFEAPRLDDDAQPRSQKQTAPLARTDRATSPGAVPHTDDVADEPPPISERAPEVPAALATLVGELLSKDPGSRPTSADVVSWRLRGILSQRDFPQADDPFLVLVVEDQDEIRSLLVEHVRRSAPHAEVLSARDAETGLSILRHRPPHLILLDLYLPGMSGVELCMYLRGTHLCDRTRIVSVSARAKPGDVALLRSLGVTTHLAKDAQIGRAISALVRQTYPKQEPREAAPVTLGRMRS